MLYIWFNHSFLVWVKIENRLIKNQGYIKVIISIVRYTYWSSFSEWFHFSEEMSTLYCIWLLFSQGNRQPTRFATPRSRDTYHLCSPLPSQDPVFSFILFSISLRIDYSGISETLPTHCPFHPRDLDMSPRTQNRCISQTYTNNKSYISYTSILWYRYDLSLTKDKTYIQKKIKVIFIRTFSWKQFWC